MAYNPIVGDILKFTFYCNLGTQYSANVRKYRVSAVTGTGRTSTTIMDALSADIGNSLRDCMANAALYYGCKMESVPTISHPAEFSFSGSGSGNEVADALPSQVAGLIRLFTATGGRKGRGRTYVPYPAETFNDANGNPTAGYLTLLAAVGAFMTGTYTVTSGGNGVTLTPILTNAPTLPTVYYPIISQSARTSWATQRRRSNINRGDVAPF